MEHSMALRNDYSDIMPAGSEIPELGADTPLTDRKRVKSVKVRAKNAEKERQATMRGIMDIAEGRRFFRWLIAQCGALQFPVNYPAPGAAIDVPGTMVNIGRMGIGHLLIAELTSCAPDLYLKMLKEAQEQIDA